MSSFHRSLSHLLDSVLPLTQVKTIQLFSDLKKILGFTEIAVLPILNTISEKMGGNMYMSEIIQKRMAFFENVIIFIIRE